MEGAQQSFRYEAGLNAVAAASLLVYVLPRHFIVSEAYRTRREYYVIPES